MGCKNCDEFDLDALEDAMFDHIITSTYDPSGDKWTVRCDSGRIVTFDSRQEAKEFIFNGGLQDV